MLASALCAVALVPALAIIRDGISFAQQIDKRHQLLLYGVSKLEEQLSTVAALDTAWPGAAPPPGNFSAEGHPNIRYVVTWSDNPVTTFYDEDGDASQDSTEPSVTLTSKIGKLASYENKAGS
jgi:hypothetical protein